MAFKTENTDYEDYHHYVVNYENEIITSKKYNENDTKILLSSSSTARYAVFYWKNELDESQPSNSTLKRKWWQWAIIGISDAVGATEGIATGVAASKFAYDLTDSKKK